jgi:hypothetical protein
MKNACRQSRIGFSFCKAIHKMLPAPPDAIIGYFTNVDNLAKGIIGKTVLVPSLSMEVNKISPAPLSSTL